MEPIEIVLLIAVALIIVRNFRKDKSDGRTITGARSGGGGGKPPMNQR